MPRFAPSTIKNKLQQQKVARKLKESKSRQRLTKRKAQAELEKDDPTVKKKRLLEKVPRTLENTRDLDPSVLPSSANNGSGPSPNEMQEDSSLDIASDPFASYFTSLNDPTQPPKILITTSQKATKSTYDFCNELVGVFPGAQFCQRKRGKAFELGRIAGWAADRRYKHLIVVNEDRKAPNAVTLVHLPEGPTAYFKLTSVELTQRIFGHARATPHNPELILNNFTTRLGHTVGRMIQTLFPPVPEFKGRQVVTLHNQRDFIFFRRHRYAFRSPEKVALQEIGPRFTLKLQWLKKGIPVARCTRETPMTLELCVGPKDAAGIVENNGMDRLPDTESERKEAQMPRGDEVLWAWKSDIQTSRRTFFL